MALIVEDGTGLLNSDSYMTIAEADTYHDKHGNSATWVNEKASVELIISVQPLDGETFTIGTKTYTLQTALVDADGNIEIGTDVEATKVNIVDGINANTSNAAVAPSMTAHPTVESTGFSGTLITIQALIDGSGGNSITTSSTFSDSSNAFSDTSLSGGEDNKEIALRNGTQYLDSKYNLRWVGRTHSRDQALDWPRDNAVKRDGWDILPNTIPQDLKDGLAEAALREITGTVLQDTDQITTGTVRSFTNKVGPLSQSKTFSDSSGHTNVAKRFPVVDTLLGPILIRKGEVRRA